MSYFFLNSKSSLWPLTHKHLDWYLSPRAKCQPVVNRWHKPTISKVRSRQFSFSLN